MNRSNRLTSLLGLNSMQRIDHLNHFRTMPQLSDVQCEVISIFKLEHPTWGYKKCCEILPQYFGAIHQRQFDGVVDQLKEEGYEAAKKRKYGSGTVSKN